MIEMSVQSLVTVLLAVAVVCAALGFLAATIADEREQRRRAGRRYVQRGARADAVTQQWGPAPMRMLTMPTRPWPTVRSGEVVDTEELHDVP